MLEICTYLDHSWFRSSRRYMSKHMRFQNYGMRHRSYRDCCHILDQTHSHLLNIECCVYFTYHIMVMDDWVNHGTKPITHLNRKSLSTVPTISAVYANSPRATTPQVPVARATMVAVAVTNFCRTIWVTTETLVCVLEWVTIKIQISMVAEFHSFCLASYM